jgi:prolyl oligopeptidase
LLCGQNLQYPQTRKSEQVDNYHGESVADPYRWLEDDRSAETEAWVKAENQVTAEYFSRIPYRDQVKRRLKELINFPRYGAPSRRGEFFFFTKNDGLQNQDVYYVSKGLEGTPRVLIDPNKFSADGTSRLLAFAPSKTGKYAAYTISVGGSDWQEGHVVEVESGRVLPDKLSWLKISGVAWWGDGFFYSRYPAPEAGRELSSKNEFETVYFHRLSTPQSQDGLVYEDKANPLRFHTVSTTKDEHFALLNISERGKGRDGNALYFRDLTKPAKNFTPVISDISDDRYSEIDNVGTRLLIETNAKAPNEKIVSYDTATGEWKSLVAERPQPIQSAETGGGKLFVSYMEDVASRAYIYNLDGQRESEIKLPAPGVVRGFTGNRDDKFVFYEFTALNTPMTIYRYDIGSGMATLFRAPEIPGFNSAQYESKEVFYKSKDGTRIPMFLVYRKGLKLDGANPTLLYAYGGFNVVMTPVFSAARLALLEQGFVFALANIRGGGEYGEKWHQAGMRLNKQNVFDDFISGAEWLISSKYTSKEKLAILGGSNGGLLMGAVVNQRPDLFRAVVAQAGVMDMLRFQKFTIGWNWIADYGSSDDPQQFKVLRAYSPIHNVRAGTVYPPILITTADHDDRVIPGHSFKYAAMMQACADARNPVLIRIDTNSGHGPSSTTKQIEQSADIYSFLFYNLGVTPRYGHGPVNAEGE